MADNSVDEIDRKRVVGHSDKSTHAGYTLDSMIRMKKAVDAIY